MIFRKDVFRQLREAKGLSHDKIAAACHVSQSMVSRWERDGKPSPRADKIPLIAAALGCREDELAYYAATDAHPIPVDLDAVAMELIRALDTIRRFLAAHDHPIP